MRYENKSLFVKREFEVKGHKIDVIEKSIFNYKEYTIDFEDFTTEKTVKKESNNGILFFVFMFALATIVIFITAIINSTKGLGSTLFFFCTFLFFLLMAFTTKRNVIILSTMYGSEGLVISFKRLNEKKAREFADGVIDQVKEYLISRYTKVDKDLPKENQLNQLISLRDRDLIDESEFLRLKNVVLEKDVDSKIGFN